MNIQKLGLDLSGLDTNIDFSQFDSILDNVDVYERSSRTTRVRVGEEIRYPVTINEVSYPGWLTVHSAKLTRLSLLRQENAQRQYWIVTGVMNPVKMDLEFEVDGKRINMIDFLFEVAKQTNPNADHSNFPSREKWIDILSRMGLNLATGEPLFFQQMGANYDSYYSVVEQLKSHFNVIHSVNKIAPERRGRIHDAFDIDGGVDISEFEVGTTDPKQNGVYTFNGTVQGFTDFGNAVFTNYMRIVKHRKEAAILKAIREKNLSNLFEDNLRTTLNQHIELEEKMASQYTHNWGGAQRVWQRQANGDYLEMPQYAVTNVPCGRLTLETPGEAIKANFWTDRRNADNPAPSGAVTIDQIKSMAGFNAD